jgi:uncharacterized protein with von Willebrand factor type A (vWA) domain
MEEKLIEFANLLRQNGVRVSLAETLDAISASDVTGLSERELFRAALRATMVKRANELPVFEELFDVYFTGLGEIIKGASKAVQDALSMSDQDFQQFLDEMDQMLKEHGDELSELAKQLLQNNDGQLERMMREAARAVRMQGIQRTIEETSPARSPVHSVSTSSKPRSRNCASSFRSSTSDRRCAPRWRSTSIAG